MDYPDHVGRRDMPGLMGEEIKILPHVSMLLLAVLGERLGAACRRTLSRGPSTSRPRFLKGKFLAALRSGWQTL